MYPTHAAVLRVLPPGEADTDLEAHCAAVRDTVEAWVEGELGGDVSVERRDTSRDSRMHAVVLRGVGRAGELREVDSGEPAAWAWDGWVERPLAPDASCALPRMLRTDLQMRADADEAGGSPGVVITLREQLAFADGARSPSRQAEMAPPSTLLGTLIERFRVHEGTIEWTRSYWTVSSARQVEQLYERIVDPGRTLPLVVCVGDEHQGPPIEPAVLGRALFGTARVVHIAQPRLTGALRERIGEKHRIGWNVIRLYRAGYSPGDSSAVHRFFRKAEIDAYTFVAFQDWLSGYLRREATYLIAPDPVVRARVRAAERRQADVARAAVEGAMASLKAQLGVVEHGSLAEAIALLTAELASAQDRLAESEVLAQSYASDLDRAKDEIYQLKARIAGLDEQVRGTTQRGLPAGMMGEPTSVREAVEQVLATVTEGELAVHDRVLKHVERQRVALDPVQVRDMLLAIRDVARLCRDNHGDGRGAVDYFRERGVQLKMGISDTARQQYASDYTIEIDRDGDRESVLMGPHIDLSIRHRIYWYHDKDAERFIVGHIGDHLRDASTG